MLTSISSINFPITAIALSWPKNPLIKGAIMADISIYDNETGASRSSNTLSGGETFIAALSIALALSEVVQNSAQGVQIEALFVDEGFGSLDQETLQKP